jgi:hypothetical protein
VDVVYPIPSPSQALENTIGAVALYMLAVVVVTSHSRIQLGRRVWKAVHFTVYFAAAAFFWRSVFTDPDLKNSPVDWLDGGKLFIEGCLTQLWSQAWSVGGAVRKTRQVNREIKSPGPDQVAS